MLILGVCGSLQAESSNLSLLRAAGAIFAEQGGDFLLYDGLRALPHFNPDLEEHQALPTVGEWRRVLAASQGLLIASPEYGHSLPGSLKNGIDWVIGTGELERKIVAVTASTPHAERGCLGLAALCSTLRAVSAQIVGGHPLVRGPNQERDLAELIAALVEKVTADGAADALTCP
jgi:chromate reductase